MGLLKRDDILQATDIKSEEVEIPEWGGSVLVYGMTGAERDAFEGSATDEKSGKVSFRNLRAKLCAMTIRDEEGKRLFNDTDILALGKKSATALQRVFDVALRLSSVTKADVEELAKNSGSDQSEDSGSD